MNIGKALKDFRIAKQIKQFVAAEGIGMTQSYLSRIEDGGQEPSTDMIKKIGDFYGVPVSAILWKATEEADVPEYKRAVFTQLKPLVDTLINQLL